MIKWIIRVAVAVVVLALLVEGATFVYIHFVEGPAPKKLTLPTSTSTTSKLPHAPPASFPAGTWSATSASTVGYRVNEVLFGQNNTAVGRTHSVTGAITLSGTEVSAATFTVRMATVHSDQSQRDAQFDGRIMDVAAFPTSSFTLTSPIALGSSTGRATAPGTTVKATATGNLTLRGQTHAVTFPVAASYTATSIDINGEIPVTFATWAIPNPGFAGITTDNHGTLEFLLVLHPSASS